MALRLTTLSFVLLLLAGIANGQRLAAVLPAETVLAVGTEDLAAHEDKLDAIVAEAERLALGDAFTALMGQSEEETDLSDEIPAGLRELTPFELFGQEAWLAVSISSFNPLPAITFTTRLDSDAAAQVVGTLVDEAEKEGAEALSEGGETIYLFPLEDAEDTPFQILAVSQVDDVFVMSSNPEVLRGVLRRLAGSSEAGFTAGQAYAATLGELGAGNGYFFMDYRRLATALEPLGAGTGFEPLIARVLAGLGSVGTVGSVTTLEQGGTTSAGIRLPGSGDPAFAALLSGGAPASREPVNFVWDSALGVGVNHLDLPGWWNYIGELVASSDELGNPNIDELVLQFTGIDIRTALFDWMGSQVATVTGELSTPVQPGMPSANLLGEVVYLIETSDESTAAQGLSLLFGTASGMVAGFADPTGMGAAAIQQREVSGVDVTSYVMGPGISIAHAVVDGWVLIGTSDAAIDAAIDANAAGGQLPTDLARLMDDIPSDATSYNLTDLSATLAQSGAQLATQMQTFSGLTGGDIDFDAIETASAAIQEFFAFLADRSGGSSSYTVEGNGVSRSVGKSEFNW
jgi:hypothetical protein